MRILDVGCGRGGFTIGVLAKKDATVIGIDFSKDFLKEAKKISPPNCEFILASASDMCFKGDSFDEIHCHHVLEHVPNMDGALDGMAETLKPSGKLVLSFPYPFLERILGNLVKDYFSEKMHRRIIRLKDLTRKLASRGIEVRKVEKRKFLVAVLLTYTFIRGMTYEPQSGLLEQRDALAGVLDKLSRWVTLDPEEVDFGKKKYFKGVLIVAKAKEGIFRHVYPHEYLMEAFKG